MQYTAGVVVKKLLYSLKATPIWGYEISYLIKVLATLLEAFTRAQLVIVF